MQNCFYMKNVFLYFAPGGGKHPGSRDDVSQPFAAHLVVSPWGSSGPESRDWGLDFNELLSASRSGVWPFCAAGT